MSGRDDDEPDDAPLLEATQFDAAFLELWLPGDDTDARQLDGIRTLLDDAGVAAGARVLDVCGGYGRIARPLAAAGYTVCCVDASAQMLALGRAEAGDALPGLRFVRADARALALEDLGGEPFDAALLVQQSFGYFATDAEHAHMMRAIGGCMRPGAVLILDLIQRDFAATAVAPRTWHPREDGRAVLHTFAFDPIEGRSHESVRVEGEPLASTRRWSLRLFNLTELARLLHAGGLDIVATYGDYDLRDFDVGEPLVVVVARRRA